MKNKWQLRFSFLCFVAISFLTVSAHAQGIGDRNRPAGRGTYKIVGKIYLPDGSPAKEVRVTVSGAGDADMTALTDLDGAYVVSGLSSGNFTVTVREKGYKTETEFITIAEGTISGQSFPAQFFLRLPGQPKRETKAANPKLADVPKAAASKYEKALEYLTKGDAKERHSAP